VELARRRQLDAEAKRAKDTVVVHMERHSYALSFVPFGAGQFQNGDSRKGWLFFGTEAVLAAASVGTFVTNFALYGVSPRRRCLITPQDDGTGVPMRCPDAQIDHSDENTSRNLLRVQVSTGAMFFAVAIWGVVDAVRNFKRDVPMSLETTKPAPAGSSADFRISATPLGVGATWRF
jgi:hypothetical protein